MWRREQFVLFNVKIIIWDMYFSYLFLIKCFKISSHLHNKETNSLQNNQFLCFSFSDSEIKKTNQHKQKKLKRLCLSHMRISLGHLCVYCCYENKWSAKISHRWKASARFRDCREYVRAGCRLWYRSAACSCQQRLME